MIIFIKISLQQSSGSQDFKNQQISLIVVIVKMVEQSCDNIPDFAEILDLEEVLHITQRRDLETLIVA